MNASLSDSILNNNEIITDITIQLVSIDHPHAICISIYIIQLVSINHPMQYASHISHSIGEYIITPCNMHLNIPLITYFQVNQVQMLIRVIPNQATRSEAQ